MRAITSKAWKRASMRLCANVPGQYGIQTALGGYQSIDDLVAPSGRLCRQRDLAYELVTAIPGVTCVKPKATLYMFPRLDPALYPIKDDQAFIAEFLKEERVLLVQGTGFNWAQPDHFRLVFLPHEDMLREAISCLARFENYRKTARNLEMKVVAVTDGRGEVVEPGVAGEGGNRPSAIASATTGGLLLAFARGVCQRCSHGRCGRRWRGRFRQCVANHTKWR